MKSGVFWFLVVALGLGALIVFLSGRNPGALAATEDRATLIYLILLLALVGGSAFLGWRGLSRREVFKNVSSVAKMAAGWVAIIGILVLGYSFRFELGQLKDRLLGELAPSSPVSTGNRQLTVRAGANGHFHITAQVNGKRVRFLVDTGASDVVLSPADARRVGFDPRRLRFTRVYRTANGLVRGAPVTLRSLAIGSLRLNSVAASVNGAPMDQSLLGQSFLRQLKSYTVSGGVLTINY